MGWEGPEGGPHGTLDWKMPGSTWICVTGREEILCLVFLWPLKNSQWMGVERGSYGRSGLTNGGPDSGWGQQPPPSGDAQPGARHGAGHRSAPWWGTISPLSEHRASLIHVSGFLSIWGYTLAGDKGSPGHQQIGF